MIDILRRRAFKAIVIEVNQIVVDEIVELMSMHERPVQKLRQEHTVDDRKLLVLRNRVVAVRAVDINNKIVALVNHHFFVLQRMERSAFQDVDKLEKAMVMRGRCFVVAQLKADTVLQHSVGTYF